MDPKDESDDWPRFCPVPSEFHSLQFDGPFTACMLCDGELTSGDRHYFIERVFRGTEPIVEYAMCLACQMEMSNEISEESQASIQDFFAQVDHYPRLRRLEDRFDAEGIGAWLDECLVTGKKRAECQGYQIVALCQGSQLELAVTPFLLSDEAVEQLIGLISKKTRDRLDDFTGEHFGMPPEFCEKPDFFPILI